MNKKVNPIITICVSAFMFGILVVLSSCDPLSLGKRAEKLQKRIAQSNVIVLPGGVDHPRRKRLLDDLAGQKDSVLYQDLLRSYYSVYSHIRFEVIDVANELKRPWLTEFLNRAMFDESPSVAEKAAQLWLKRNPSWQQVARVLDEPLIHPDARVLVCADAEKRAGITWAVPLPVATTKAKAMSVRQILMARDPNVFERARKPWSAIFARDVSGAVVQSFQDNKSYGFRLLDLDDYVALLKEVDVQALAKTDLQDLIKGPGVPWPSLFFPLGRFLLSDKEPEIFVACDVKGVFLYDEVALQKAALWCRARHVRPDNAEDTNDAALSFSSPPIGVAP